MVLEHNFEDKTEILFIIKLSKQRLMLSRHLESQNLTYDQEQHQIIIIKKSIHLFGVCECHFIFEMLMILNICVS